MRLAGWMIVVCVAASASAAELAGFVPGPATSNHRGAFPNGQNGFPNQPFGQGQNQNSR